MRRPVCVWIPGRFSCCSHRLSCACSETKKRKTRNKRSAPSSYQLEHQPPFQSSFMVFKRPFKGRVHYFYFYFLGFYIIL